MTDQQKEKRKPTYLPACLPAYLYKYANTHICSLTWLFLIFYGCL